MTTHNLTGHNSQFGALKLDQPVRIRIAWDELGALFFDELSSPDQASFLACVAFRFREAGGPGLMQMEYIAGNVLDSQREQIADFYADLAEIIRDGKQVRS